MKVIVVALGLALATQAAFGQASLNTDVKGGANVNAPGVQMQQKGSVKGTTGASGYAPGQQMQTKGSIKGTTGGPVTRPVRSRPTPTFAATSR